MKSISLKQFGLLSGTIVGTLSLAIIPASALKSGTATTASSANDAARLQTIITRGNTEIGRRLTTLGTLTTKISAATKLSASDKSSLSSEVSDEVSGLTALKTKLDADTDLATAKTDAQSIFNDYRVYALVVPKVALVKTADDQQVAEGKLSDLATKLQTKITADQTAGKNVASLQTKLDDMTAKVQAAQAISSSIQSKVVNLQPTDYNGDHSLLSGDRDQLKTAQTDIATATSDAKSIVSGLKSL